MSRLALIIGAFKSWKLKGRHREGGLDIAIENPKGDVRHWHNPDTGEDGQTTMEFPYGYVRRTWGMDGEEIDVFLGPLPFAMNDVHIVTTKRAPDFVHDDEQKCFLGFPSREDAKRAFLRHYQSPKFFGSMASMSFDDFRRQALGTVDTGGAVVGKGITVKPYLRQGHMVKGYVREGGGEAFQRWFEGSQAVSETGEPLVLFHGTRRDFSTFTQQVGRNSNVFGGWDTKRAGFFFTDDPRMAETYATQGGETEGANIMPVVLAVFSPLDLRKGFSIPFLNTIEAEGWNTRYFENISPSQVWEIFDEENGGHEFVALLKKLGYDGARIPDEGGDSWIVFDAKQIKSAIGNRGTYDMNDPDITKALAMKDTVQVAPHLRGGKPVLGYTQRRRAAGLGSGAPAFDQWFAGSKVVDQHGQPLVVYHGTTHVIEAFDPEKHGNPEGDWGAGIYFTNSEGDVAENYAGYGPDLTSRIEQRKEEHVSRDETLTESQAYERAEEELVGDAEGGVTMPVYLAIKNPLVLGGDDETAFTFEEETEEGEDGEIEYTGASSGTLIDFCDALRDEANEYHDIDAEKINGALMQRAIENGGSLSAAELVETWMEADAHYASDDVGRLVHKEILRATLARAGFDGIIDRTVNKKFGSEREYGRPMAGMTKGTVHYVAFRSEQVKSAIGNQGTYDPKNPDIAKAVARVKPHQRKGKPVRGYQQKRRGAKRKITQEDAFDLAMKRAAETQAHIEQLRVQAREKAAAQPKHERYARKKAAWAYHALWRAEDLDGIRRDGLVPSKDQDASRPELFFTDDESDAENYVQDGAPLLRFPLPRDAMPAGDGMTTTEVVPPESIEMRTSTGWVPLSAGATPKGEGPKEPSFKPTSAALRWAQQAGAKLAEGPDEEKPYKQASHAFVRAQGQMNRERYGDNCAACDRPEGDHPIDTPAATPLPHVPAGEWFQHKIDITDALEANGYALSSGYQAGDSSEVYIAEVGPDATGEGITFAEGNNAERRVIIDRYGWRMGALVGSDTASLGEALGIPVAEGAPTASQIQEALDATEGFKGEPSRSVFDDEKLETKWKGQRPPDDYEDLDNDDNAPKGAQRGWIDPGGHFHDLGMDGNYWHLDWLRHKGYGHGRHDNYRRMLDAGWIRTVDSHTYEVGSEADFKRVAAFAQDRYGLADGDHISVDIGTPIDVDSGEKAKRTNTGQGDVRIESLVICVAHGREECRECFRLDKGRHGVKSTTQWRQGYGDALRGGEPESDHPWYREGYGAALAAVEDVMPALLVPFQKGVVVAPQTLCERCEFESPGDVCEVCETPFAVKAIPTRPLWPKKPCGSKGGCITLDLHGLKVLNEVFRLVRTAVGREGIVGARVTPDAEIAIVCPDFQKLDVVQKELQRLPDLCDPEHRTDQVGVSGYHCTVRGVPLVLRTERIQKHAFEAQQLDDGTPEMQAHLAEVGKHHELADRGVASKRPQPPVRRGAA